MHQRFRKNSIIFSLENGKFAVLYDGFPSTTEKKLNPTEPCSFSRIGENVGVT